jgi:hypothetical protein
MPSSATMRYLLNSMADEMGAPQRKRKFLIGARKLRQVFFPSKAISHSCASAMFYD